MHMRHALLAQVQALQEAADILGDGDRGTLQRPEVEASIPGGEGLLR